MPVNTSIPKHKQRLQTLFFSTPEMTQRLDLLIHLTENSELIPLVKGGAGIGKTSMVFQLQARVGEHWHLCRIDANPMLQTGQLLGQCAGYWGITDRDGRVMERLVHCFQDLQEAGQFPVMIIDDAHLLPSATIISLLRLHEKRHGGFPLVRIVLFADPGIDQLLASPELQAMNLERLHTLDIPPLSQQQIPDFIKYVLSAQGSSRTIALQTTEIRRLFRESGGGVPGRLIKLIKSGVPGAGMVNGAKGGLRNYLPSGAITGAAVGGFLVLLVLIYQDPINALFEPNGSSTPDPAENPTTASFEPLPNQTAEPESTWSAMPSAAPVIRPLPVPPAPSVWKAPTTPKGLAATSSVATLGVETRPMPVEERMPPPIPVAALPPSPSPEFGKEATGSASITVSEESIRGEATKLEKPLDRRTEEASVSSVPGPAPGQAATAPVANVPVTDPVAAKPSDNPPESIAKPALIERFVDTGMRREAWLLKQQPEAFTLQLLGVRDATGLKRFVSRYGLQDKAVYFVTPRDGKPWYALLYGVYPDRQAALAGKAQLPKRLLKRDVWMRRIGSIQKALRASGPTSIY